MRLRERRDFLRNWEIRVWFPVCILRRRKHWLCLISFRNRQIIFIWFCSLEIRRLRSFGSQRNSWLRIRFISFDQSQLVWNFSGIVIYRSLSRFLTHCVELRQKSFLWLPDTLLNLLKIIVILVWIEISWWVSNVDRFHRLDTRVLSIGRMLENLHLVHLCVKAFCIFSHLLD